MEASANNQASPLLENALMFKALGDETRLRMLGLLAQGELCVCDIMEVLILPQSTASRHLAYLKNAKWISGTRRGKWMYYRLDENIINGSIHNGIIHYLAGLKEVTADHQKLICFQQKKDKQSCN
ncbi:MAG: metalloregulator ArsR/SmtB family transcription factor [Desulforhopalus sp.]